MPKIKTKRTKRAPEGFQKVETKIIEFEEQMKQIYEKPGEKRRKIENA